jgi:hypothetical protein
MNDLLTNQWAFWATFHDGPGEYKDLNVNSVHTNSPYNQYASSTKKKICVHQLRILDALGRSVPVQVHSKLIPSHGRLHRKLHINLYLSYYPVRLNLSTRLISHFSLQLTLSVSLSNS